MVTRLRNGFYVAKLLPQKKAQEGLWALGKLRVMGMRTLLQIQVVAKMMGTDANIHGNMTKNGNYPVPNHL